MRARWRVCGRVRAARTHSAVYRQMMRAVRGGAAIFRSVDADTALTPRHDDITLPTEMPDYLMLPLITLSLCSFVYARCNVFDPTRHA